MECNEEGVLYVCVKEVRKVGRAEKEEQLEYRSHLVLHTEKIGRFIVHPSRCLTCASHENGCDSDVNDVLRYDSEVRERK